MAAAVPPYAPPADYWINKVEQHDVAIGDLQVNEATLATLVAGLQNEVGGVRTSLNKVFWALIGLLITIASAAVTYAMFLPHPG
jgi:hypothetical protein